MSSSKIKIFRNANPDTLEEAYNTWSAENKARLVDTPTLEYCVALQQFMVLCAYYVEEDIDASPPSAC